MQRIDVSPNLVFVVDDVPENLELAAIYLRKLGWEAKCYESATTAQLALEDHLPAYILLDIKMPGTDGISLARSIRNSMGNTTTKIVAYTAHALRDEVERIRESGFDDILIKPVTYQNMSDCFGVNGLIFL